MIARNIGQVLRLWQWVAVACLALTLAAPASAALQEMRIVAVGIDNSSMQAEQEAMDYARKRAVFLATKKMGVKDAEKAIQGFTERDFKEIVRGMNVTQSRRVGERSYLEVMVTIVDESLRRVLKLPPPTIDPSTLKMRAVMLFPVYVASERSYMWEKENIMRAPISDELRRQSRGGVLLPGGDLQDLRLIDYQNALTIEPEELQPTFERYGADEIIIAATKLSQPGTTDSTNIIMRRLEPQRVRNEVLEIMPESREETEQVRIQKAASAIAGAATQIASSTAERERAIRDKAQKIKVRFSYAIPKELARMQDAVKQSPEVLTLDMPSIALARVTGTIYLKGSIEKLQDDLVKQGIIVTPINDGWRLSVR